MAGKGKRKAMSNETSKLPNKRLAASQSKTNGSEGSRGLVAHNERKGRKTKAAITKLNQNPRASDEDASEEGALVPSKEVKVSLRTLSTSPRYFWKSTFDEQKRFWGKGGIRFKIVEPSPSGDTRILPGNEIFALASNERAADRRVGYVLHAPPRKSWRKLSQASGGRQMQPKTRAKAEPDGCFMFTFYMDFAWSERAVRSFQNASHRTRDIASSILMNPPRLNVPLYPIQYASSTEDALYDTSLLDNAFTSIIVLAAPHAFYITTSSKLRMVVDLKPGDKGGSRISTMAWLWSGDGYIKEPRLMHAIHTFLVPNLEVVYDTIVTMCEKEVDPAFDVATWFAGIPLPLELEDGVGLKGVIDAARPKLGVKFPHRKQRQGRSSGKDHGDRIMIEEYVYNHGAGSKSGNDDDKK